MGVELGISELEGSMSTRWTWKSKTITFHSLQNLAKTSYSNFVADFFTSVTDENKNLVTLPLYVLEPSMYVPFWSP